MVMSIGRKADKSVLPEALQAREKPSSRNLITQLIFEGGFPK